MNHETIRQSPFVFRSVNMVWFKCQTIAGAPAGGTDGPHSEQHECEERVFSCLCPTLHLPEPRLRYLEEELQRKKGDPFQERKDLQRAFQWRRPNT